LVRLDNAVFSRALPKYFSGKDVADIPPPALDYE